VYYSAYVCITHYLIDMCQWKHCICIISFRFGSSLDLDPRKRVKETAVLSNRKEHVLVLVCADLTMDL
jgi:hypothetical protein